MDGFNDAGVGCNYSQGPGNPMYFATMRSYIDGYLMSTLHPVFYRGWFENKLIEHSKAYRIITGKQYVPDDRIFDQSSTESSQFRRQIIPTKVGEARQTLAFYLASERGMLHSFPAGALHFVHAAGGQSRLPATSTTSMTFRSARRSGRPLFRSGPQIPRNLSHAIRERDVRPRHRASEPHLCFRQRRAPARAVGRRSSRARQGGRDYNRKTPFSGTRPEHMPYFSDPVHLSDKGMDEIGKFYAEKILAADRERPAAATVSAPAAASATPHPLLRPPLRQTPNSTNGIFWWA